MEEMKNNKKQKIIYGVGGAVIGILLATSITFGTLYAKAGSKKVNETYKVSYVVNDQVVYEETVAKGQGVSQIPTVPSKEGYTASWSQDGSKIESNTIITATYTPRVYNIKYITNYISVDTLYMFATCNDFYIEDYAAGMNTLYGKYRTDVNQNLEFVLHGQKLHFDSTKSNVLDEQQQVVATVFQEKFTIEGVEYSVDFFDEGGGDIHWYMNPVGVDDYGIFVLDGVTYQVDQENYQVINMETKHNVCREMEYMNSSQTYTYDPQRGIAYELSIEDDAVPVIDNEFTFKGVHYIINPAENIEYHLSQQEAGWRNESFKPTKLTYTYGEDLVFDINLFYEKINFVQTSNGEITSISSTLIMGYCTAEGSMIVSRHGRNDYYSTNGITTYHQPIGDIIVGIDFGPEYS